MTQASFRRLALSLPEAVEGQHMNHPDFRICGRIFATLMPHQSSRTATETQFGMVKLTPIQQARFMKESPEVYSPVPGGWGVRGATRVLLKKARKQVVQRALAAAWCNAAPRRLVAEIGHTLIQVPTHPSPETSSRFEQDRSPLRIQPNARRDRKN